MEITVPPIKKLKGLRKATSEETPISKRAFEVDETQLGGRAPELGIPKANHIVNARTKKIKKTTRAEAMRLSTQPTLILAGSRASAEYTSIGIQAIQSSDETDSTFVKSCEAAPLAKSPRKLPDADAKLR